MYSGTVLRVGRCWGLTHTVCHTGGTVWQTLFCRTLVGCWEGTGFSPICLFACAVTDACMDVTGSVLHTPVLFALSSCNVYSSRLRHTLRVLPRCQLGRMAVHAVSKLHTFDQEVIGDRSEPAAQRMQHLCGSNLLLECQARCNVSKSGPVVCCRDNGHVCGLVWPLKCGGGGGALGVYLLPTFRFVWGAGAVVEFLLAHASPCSSGCLGLPCMSRVCQVLSATQHAYLGLCLGATMRFDGFGVPLLATGT